MVAASFCGGAAVREDGAGVLSGGGCSRGSRSIGGRSGLRLELPNGVVLHGQCKTGSSESFAYVHDLLLKMMWLLAEHNLEVLDVEATNRLSTAEFRACAK